MFLRFLLWWEYFKKFFFQALGSAFQGRPVKFYFMAIIQAIGKWYMIMIPPSIYVVYKLYEALKNAGILDALQRIVESTLYSVIYIANNCFQKILNLNEMLECITYAPSDNTLPGRALSAPEDYNYQALSSTYDYYSSFSIIDYIHLANVTGVL